CQDTGMPMVILEIGQEVRVIGDLKSAVNNGVELGYKKGSLRESIIKDPLARGNSGYTPALIYTDIIRGNKIKITVLPKGFGCENKSQLKMFKPTVRVSEIKKFIIDAVVKEYW
ncbi:MAG: fumarate hydratase, partial [Candidatus Omnitrophica bacterium]|nr:fumarate hydratase [Candidatus Omnitrophota bacterium]